MRTIDILLATYNGEKYIEQLLDSLLAQTISDWHLLVRDDGSTDNTLELIECFSRDNPGKVTLLKDALGNLGVIQNFQCLMKESKAPYVMFADQDDIWLETKIQVTLEEMLSVESDLSEKRGVPCLVFTDMKITDQSNGLICKSYWRYSRVYPSFSEKFKNNVTQNVVAGCTIMVNRSLVEQIKGFPSGVIMHDWWIVMFASAFGVVSYVGVPTIEYRQHENNDVGANHWGWRYIIRSTFGSKLALRRGIYLTQRQAQAFVAQYGDRLRISEKRFLLSYSKLSSQSWFERKLSALRLRVKRTTMLRSVGFYFLV